MTNIEDTAHLLIFLDDTLAVEESESMTARIGTVEDMSQLFLIHSLTGISDDDFYVFIMFLCRNSNLTSSRSKLACIVGDSIDHKERQGAVCLHLSCSWLHIEFYLLHLETHLALCHNIEKRLERERDDTEIQSSLSHLNPVGQDGVILVDLIRQF